MMKTRSAYEMSLKVNIQLCTDEIDVLCFLDSAANRDILDEIKTINEQLVRCERALVDHIKNKAEVGTLIIATASDSNHVLLCTTALSV